MAADSVDVSAKPFPVEMIPSEDKVLMRAHAMYFERSGVLGVGVIRAHGTSMSVNWEKYATAESTRSQATKPIANAVIAFQVGQVRGLDLAVQHEPLANNQAHAGIVLPSMDEPGFAEKRVRLLRLANIVLPLPGSL